MQQLVIVAGIVCSLSFSLIGYRNLAPNTLLDYSLPTVSSAHDQQEPGEIMSSHPRSNGSSAGACTGPTRQRQAAYLEIEQRILASTVRLVLQRWVKKEADGDYTFVGGSAGLATIKDTQYLVTHNHHGISFSGVEDQAVIKAFVAPLRGGDLTWSEVRLQQAAVAVEDAETLVLELAGVEREPLFESSRVNFKALESVPLQPGMEVAQVDWDGVSAHIDWVVIDEIITTRGVPRLKLNNVVEPGASGGGVFWNGYHIANTWSQVTTYDADSGAVLRQQSVAALNSRPLSSFPYNTKSPLW